MFEMWTNKLLTWNRYLSSVSRRFSPAQVHERLIADMSAPLKTLLLGTGLEEAPHCPEHLTAAQLSEDRGYAESEDDFSPLPSDPELAAGALARPLAVESRRRICVSYIIGPDALCLINTSILYRCQNFMAESEFIIAQALRSSLPARVLFPGSSFIPRPGPICVFYRLGSDFNPDVGFLSPRTRLIRHWVVQPRRDWPYSYVMGRQR